MQSRIVKTECANCGEPVEVDLAGDPGADRHSAHEATVYCSWACESEAEGV